MFVPTGLTSFLKLFRKLLKLAPSPYPPFLSVLFPSLSIPSWADRQFCYRGKKKPLFFNFLHWSFSFLVISTALDEPVCLLIHTWAGIKPTFLSRCPSAGCTVQDYNHPAKKAGQWANCLQLEGILSRYKRHLQQFFLGLELQLIMGFSLDLLKLKRDNSPEVRFLLLLNPVLGLGIDTSTSRCSVIQTAKCLFFFFF